ncbi:Cohesin subunit SA-3 [Aix galericulata]|nr:Cohesin subunit SA-3 [Aix galericulata]
MALGGTGRHWEPPQPPPSPSQSPPISPQPLPVPPNPSQSPLDHPNSPPSPSQFPPVSFSALPAPPVPPSPCPSPSQSIPVPPKEKRAVAEQRSRLSLCLAPILPRLLAKFSADEEKVTPLLEVLSCVELNVYCTARLERPLEQALAQLQELVQKHTGLGVLGAAARALGALCDPRLPLRGRGELARSRLGDLLGERCHRLLRVRGGRGDLGGIWGGFGGIWGG